MDEVRAEVVGGAANGLKEHGNELARGGESAKVGDQERNRRNVAKDVGKGSRGEVVVGDEVDVGDAENGEGGAVQ